jgi:hypothetical protein
MTKVQYIYIYIYILLEYFDSTVRDGLIFGAWGVIQNCVKDEKKIFKEKKKSRTVLGLFIYFF